MSFDEIERIVGSLPASARNYDAWWLDNSDDTAHTQASSGWLAAGWIVASVDRRAARVTFQRSR